MTPDSYNVNFNTAYNYVITVITPVFLIWWTVAWAFSYLIDGAASQADTPSDEPD